MPTYVVEVIPSESGATPGTSEHLRKGGLPAGNRGPNLLQPLQHTHGACQQAHDPFLRRREDGFPPEKPSEQGCAFAASDRDVGICLPLPKAASAQAQSEQGDAKWRNHSYWEKTVGGCYRAGGLAYPRRHTVRLSRGFNWHMERGSPRQLTKIETAVEQNAMSHGSEQLLRGTSCLANPQNRTDLNWRPVCFTVRPFPAIKVKLVILRAALGS